MHFSDHLKLRPFEVLVASHHMKAPACRQEFKPPKPLLLTICSFKKDYPTPHPLRYRSKTTLARQQPQCCRGQVLYYLLGLGYLGPKPRLVTGGQKGTIIIFASYYSICIRKVSSQLLFSSRTFVTFLECMFIAGFWCQAMHKRFLRRFDTHTSTTYHEMVGSILNTTYHFMSVCVFDQFFDPLPNKLFQI